MWISSLAAWVLRRWQALARHPIRLVLFLAIGAAVLAAWRVRAPWWVLAALLASDAALVVWGWRIGRPLQLVGPLLVYDLARLARRGRTTLLRCLYAGLFLAWLCVMALAQFPDVSLAGFFGPATALSLDQWADFARGFVISLLSLQAGAVLVFTPAYVGGAVAEEKERRTLDLLFATDLHDRELVLGKLLGRMLHLAIILLAALPIFALARLWGGIDDNLLVAGLAVAALSLLSTSGMSMLCSVCLRTVLGAVTCSYLLVFVLNVCCLVLPSASTLLFVSAWDAQVAAEWKDWLAEIEAAQGFGLPVFTPVPNPTKTLLWMLVPLGLLHVSIFLACTVASILVLRRCGLAPGEVVKRGVLPPDQPVLTSGPLLLLPIDIPWQPVLAAYTPRPVSEPALLWKEMVHGTTDATRRPEGNQPTPKGEQGEHRPAEQIAELYQDPRPPVRKPPQEQ